jgi:hypothetical protein
MYKIQISTHAQLFVCTLDFTVLLREEEGEAGVGLLIAVPCH